MGVSGVETVGLRVVDSVGDNEGEHDRTDRGLSRLERPTQGD